MSDRKRRREAKPPRVEVTFEEEELSKEDQQIAAEYAAKHRRLCSRRHVIEAIQLLGSVQKLGELPSDLMGVVEAIQADLQHVQAELGERWK